MKTKTLTIATGFNDPRLEDIINKRDYELKQQMRKSAKHFAKSNRPLPIGDQLLAYIGEAKAGYEHLIAFVYQYLQPDSHIPNAKIDEMRFGNKVQTLDKEIGQKNSYADNLENDLNGYHRGSVPIRLWVIGVFTIIIMVAEVVFNTDAFQEWGDSMLFALLLSIGLSVGVFAFAHISAHIYKGQPTRLRKFLSSLASMLTVSVVFSTVAMLRTQYLSDQEIKSSPFDFMSINLFLFLVSFLLSVFGLPEWDEIKEHFEKLRTLNKIAKQKREVSNLQNEKGIVLDTYTENTKDRIALGHYTKDSINRVKKLYLEAVEIFKSNCLAYRTDNKTPECFHNVVPALDLPEYQFNFTLDDQP